MRIEDRDAARSPWGTRTIEVDNGALSFQLFPELGAKIFSVLHTRTDKELLWRNPGLSPSESPNSGSFDDCWTGGWDELFPNDEPARVGERSFPDHGELWSAKWECQIDSDWTVYLRTECPTSQTLVEKWITAPLGEERIRFRHRFTNLSDNELLYLWKIHPALAVSPGDSILIPAARIALETEFLGSLAGAPLESRTPVLELPDRTVDLRVVPPSVSREVHFFYGLDLVDGWCASYDPARRLAVALAFPKELFTSCWLFASYGGWRDHYVAVLEPCTAHPFRLEDAVAKGQCPILPPRGVQEAEIVFATRLGLDGVKHVSAEGEIV